MAWTDEQRYFCLYVIGAVESDWDYGATNQTDAITVGIAQWYGDRAAALIERLRTSVPESYAALSERIRTAVEGGATDWSRFYLLTADAQSWRAASEVDGNHQLQEQQFMDDLEGYLDTLSYWSVNVDNVRSAIFYVSMYHQSPRACLRVVQGYGGDRDVDTLYAAAMNDATLAGYPSRYREVRDLLNAWDGTSAPPDFGQEGGVTPEEPTTDDEVSSAVAYIQEVGNDLVVFGDMSSTSRLLCHSTGRGIWIPKGGTMPDNPGTVVPPGGGGGDPADFAGMRALWEQHASEWQYGNGAGRLSPTTSGYSDCSACIWWAANAATGNKYSWLGTRSYTIPDTCHTVIDLDWTLPELDISDWQAGDIICMNYRLPSGYDGGHAEWYFGSGDLWSAGAAPLPRQVEFGTVASRYYRQWQSGVVFRWLRLCRFL